MAVILTTRTTFVGHGGIHCNCCTDFPPSGKPKARRRVKRRERQELRRSIRNQTIGDNY